MPKKAEYKVVSGSEREIEVELAKLNMGGPQFPRQKAQSFSSSWNTVSPKGRNKNYSPARARAAGAVFFRNQSLPGALQTLLLILPTFTFATRTILKRIMDGRFVNSTTAFTTKLLGALSVDL